MMNEQENGMQGMNPAGDKIKKMSVHHLIVLDESASMRYIKKQIVDGCNETIQSIRLMQEKEADIQEHFVSIYLFSTNSCRYLVHNLPVAAVTEIKDNEYKPNSLTPLFDALGYTLTQMKQLVAQPDTFGYVTIITDGMENSSRVYDLTVVRSIIDNLKKKNVIFSFIGANIDAKSYAEELHIDNALQFKQDDKGTRNMWALENFSKMRSNAKLSFRRRFMSDMDDGFCNEENAGNYYKFEVSPDRITPNGIQSLDKNEVFVFGSYYDGIHNKGYAAVPVERLGALNHCEEGIQGQSFGIWAEHNLPLSVVYRSVQFFTEYARKHPELTFYVTPVGCSVHGPGLDKVAPMFQEAAQLPNVKLPEAFWKYVTCYR